MTLPRFFQHRPRMTTADWALKLIQLSAYLFQGPTFGQRFAVWQFSIPPAVQLSVYTSQL